MARFYRTSAGPVIVGASVWCAMGTVAVLSNADSTVRVVALAPWWVAVSAALLAALFPAWRTRPGTALPALLSTLPWWPVPVPAIALVWSGALAWVPIGAALLAAEGGRALAWLARLPGASATDGDHAPRRSMWLAAAGSLVIALGAAWAGAPNMPGGDEPHYLIITQSLLKDGDLQIENNHAAGDYAAFYAGTLDAHFLVPGRNKAIYSIHAPGLPAIVLPAFALFGFRGAQTTLILLFAITGALMWRTAWHLTRDSSAAWFAWAAVAGSTTLVVMSFKIFPDAPGACAVAAGVWLLVAHREASSRALMAASAALSILPWLHARFSVLAGALGLAIVVMLLADRVRPMSSRVRRVATLSLIPVASAVAWFSMFFVLYGTFDPRVPYGPEPEIREWIWGAVAGLFLDQQFGLMAYAPVLLVALAAPWVRAERRWRLLSALCLGIALLYAAVVATYWMWWAGVPGLPARFLTASLPLLSVPLSVVWARAGSANRALLLAILTASLGITMLIVGVDQGEMSLNFRDGQAAWLRWLNPLVNLPRAWPSFFWDSEGSFLRHAAMLISLMAVAWAGIRARAHRASNPEGMRLTIAYLLPLAFMLIVAAGWMLTGTSPLNPARAQLVVHAAAGEGRPVWQVGLGVRRWDPVGAPLRIRQDQPRLTDDPSSTVLGLLNLPGGLYRLEVTSAGLSGELAVFIGHSAEPLLRFVVGPSSPQAQMLSLPAGAEAFNVVAGTPDLARQVQATLVTVSVARPGRVLARTSGSYPNENAFFLDENIFSEPEGFWVHAGETAEVVLSRGAAAANRTGLLTVRNGPVANTVTIRFGAWHEELRLEAGQARDVALPPADALGSWALTIASATGFQQPDPSGGGTRFLGAWIR